MAINLNISGSLTVGGGVQLSNLTASRVLVTDGSKNIAASAVTSTELGYLDGVSSNIQTQLGNKANSSHTHSGTQVTGLTASRALMSNSSGQVAVSAVTSTELGYLDGVTSKIQTQLNNKASSSHTHGRTITTASLLSTVSSSNNHICKCNSFVVMNLNFALKNGAGSTSTHKIGTVPTGYRPIGIIDSTVNTGSGIPVYVSINSSGVVNMFTNNAIPAGDTIAFNLTWVV